MVNNSQKKLFKQQLAAEYCINPENKLAFDIFRCLIDGVSHSGHKEFYSQIMGHPPSDKFEGAHFYTYLTPSSNKKAQYDRFKENFSDYLGSWKNTFEPAKRNGLGVDTARSVFYLSAKVQGKSSEQLLYEFLNYYRGEEQLSFLCFKEIEPKIDEYLAKYLSEKTIPKKNQKFDDSPTDFQIKLEPPPVKEHVFAYYGNQNIEILGRGDEQARLREFLFHVDEDNQFYWFQLAGVAGQGKSRLALDLIEEATQKGWNAGFISDYWLNQLNAHWEEWQPNMPQLIVLDYVVGRIDKLQPVFAHLRNKIQPISYPIRLLLLERQPWNQELGRRNGQFETPTNQSEEFSIGKGSNRAEWFLSLAERPDGDDLSLKKARFKFGVLTLEALDSNILVDIIERIVAAIPHSQLEILDQDTRELVKMQLEEIDISGSPLYAHFLAEELAAGIESQVWTRKNLLTAVLQRERMRWWASSNNKPPLLEEDTLASRLALLATMIGVFDSGSDRAMQLVGRFDPDVRHQAAVMTGQFSSNSFSKKVVPPEKIEGMQPDLLGEWYVLCCFKNEQTLKEVANIAWQYSPEKMGGFINRLCEDFPSHPVTSRILNSISLNSLDKEVLSQFVNAILIQHLKNKIEIPKLVIDSLKVSAENGNAASLGNLGLCYAFGLGVEPDINNAFTCFKKGAKLGCSTATFNTGLCYGAGRGVRRDYKKAVSFYHQAAEQGKVEAMFVLGSCYANGEGVKQDDSKAEKYFCQASEFGHVFATYNLGVLYATNRDVENNPSKAVECYRKIADIGSKDGMFGLALCYATGLGVNKDEELAVELFSQASELGHASAMHNLGILYDNGRGVKRNQAKAQECFKKAEELRYLDTPAV